MAERDDNEREPVAGPSRRSWWERWRADGATAGSDPAAFSPPDDLIAAAERRGWTVQETAEQALAALLSDSPLRLTSEHRAVPVARGRVGSWEVLACDVRYLMPRGDLSTALYAVTAIPIPLPLPAVRVSPRRFLTHGAGGLFVVPSGNPEFDARWRILAGQDTPEIRGLAGPALQAVLLDGPDLDELWTADGHLAASRADGHREPVLAQHTGALVAALDGLRQAL